MNEEKRGLFGVDWLTVEVLSLLIEALFAGIGQIVKLTKTTRDDEVFNGIAKFFSGILPGLATLIIAQAVRGATGDDINAVIKLVDNAAGKLDLAPLSGSSTPAASVEQILTSPINLTKHNALKESITSFVEKLKAGLQKRSTVPASEK